MKNRTLRTIALSLMIPVLLSLVGGLAFAAERTTLTPELAAKREVVRKQQKQRVTSKQRKTAAEALKAERLKIYKARQEAQQLNPSPTNFK